MDREIDYKYRRKQLIRKTILIACFFGALAIIFFFGQSFIRPSVERDRIRTAKVEKGSIEATITAEGMVVPEIESVLSSPVNARILKIMKRPGAILIKGEPIIELDLNEPRLAIEKLNQQIELKLNQQIKTKLELENRLITLKNQWEIKDLEYKNAQSVGMQNKTLFNEGFISKEDLRKADLNEQKTRVELKQLKESIRNEEELTKIKLEGLMLEIKTLKKENQEAQRQFELATTKADRDGVLTWVVSEEGVTINKGAVLARIADLSSFRVEATVSDVHSGRLVVGLPVKVEIDDKILTGHIARIDPKIDNGVISFHIDLDEKSSPLLRSNLRVDVQVITYQKGQVLRIRKGPFANAEGIHDIFVIQREKAVRKPVEFGIASRDYYEIIEGLVEGDEVIISDMSDFIHIKELKIK